LFASVHAKNSQLIRRPFAASGGRRDDGAQDLDGARALRRCPPRARRGAPRREGQGIRDKAVAMEQHLQREASRTMTNERLAQMNRLVERLTEIFRMADFPPKVLVGLLVCHIAILMCKERTDPTGMDLAVRAMMTSLGVEVEVLHEEVTVLKKEMQAVLLAFEDLTAADVINVLCALVTTGLQVVDPNLDDETAIARTGVAIRAGVKAVGLGDGFLGSGDPLTAVH
jgi:hypothetical protein